VATGLGHSTSDGLWIRVTAIDRDAEAEVLAENMFNDPPPSGEVFVMVTLEVINEGGSVNEIVRLDEFDYSFVGSSQVVYTPASNSCGVTPNELEASVFKGGAASGTVCVSIPADEVDSLAMFYDASFFGSDRSWFSLDQEIFSEAQPTVSIDLAPRPVPVSSGLGYSTSDGLWIRVTAIDRDAEPEVMAENMFNDPAPAGEAFVMVTLDVVNEGGSENEYVSVSQYDYSFVGSRQVVYIPASNSCGVIPNDLDASYFKGGLATGAVCVSVPEDDVDSLVMFYEQLFGSEDRTWFGLQPEVAADVRPTVSVDLSPDGSTAVGRSRTNPASSGTTIRGDDGIEVTVTGVNPDAWPMVQSENMFNDPPAEGFRFLMMTLDVANQGSETSETRVATGDFRVVGNDAILRHTFGCGLIPNRLDLSLFPGGSGAGNICAEVPSSLTGVILIYESGFFTDNWVYASLGGGADR